MSGFVWQTTPKDAFVGLFDAYEQTLRNAVIMVCARRAPEIQNWMKGNAPWTDRTGNARQTLWAAVQSALTEVVVILSHGMDYGYWLETANAGRYAIVAPAVDHWAPIIFRDVQELMR